MKKDLSVCVYMSYIYIYIIYIHTQKIKEIILIVQGLKSVCVQNLQFTEAKKKKKKEEAATLTACL